MLFADGTGSERARAGGLDRRAHADQGRSGRMMCRLASAFHIARWAQAGQQGRLATAGRSASSLQPALAPHRTGPQLLHESQPICSVSAWARLNVPAPARCHGSTMRTVVFPDKPEHGTAELPRRRTLLHCGRCTALHCTALHCTALHCTALHCTALHCTALHCSAAVPLGRSGPVHERRSRLSPKMIVAQHGAIWHTSHATR